MQVFVVLLLCWASCWCLVSSDAVVVDLEAIRKCLNQKNENRKFQRYLKQKRFYMQLGNHSLEGFYTIPPYHIQQVVFLAQCVEMLHKELFWTSEQSFQVYNRFGGGNVTFLTGILPSLLPDVAEHYHGVLSQGLDHWLERPSDRKKVTQTFGIRGIYFLSGEREGLDLFHHMFDLKRKRKLPESLTDAPPPSIKPSDFDAYRRIHQYLMIRGKERNIQRARFVADHSGDEYTLYGAFTDVSESCNADYLVERHAFSDDGEDEEDEYDDIGGEVSVPQYQPHSADDAPRSTLRGKTQEPKTEEKVVDPEDVHSYINDRFENFLLDRFQTLIIRSNSHGPNELVCGRRQAVVIDYWQYADAPAQSGVMSESEGALLGLMPQRVDNKGNEL